MQTYKVCNDSGEDPTCSNKYFPNYNRDDHDFYFFAISGKGNCKAAWMEITNWVIIEVIEYMMDAKFIWCKKDFMKE